jgi:hypothetical protein
MITQSINLHTEPVVVYSGGSYIPTEEQFNKALEEAEKVVSIGDKFKYKSSNTIFTVVGFHETPKTVTKYKESLAIVKTKRDHSPDNMVSFSVDELYGTYMEPYFEGEGQC